MKDEIQALFDSYPNFKDCSLQTFDDMKDRADKSLAKILNNTDNSYKELDRLNGL
jgi:hypothetical protein